MLPKTRRRHSRSAVAVLIAVISVAEVGCQHLQDIEIAFDVPTEHRAAALTLLRAGLALTPGTCAAQAVAEVEKKHLEIELPQRTQPIPGAEGYCAQYKIDDGKLFGYGVCARPLTSETTRIGFVSTRYEMDGQTTVQQFDSGLQNYVTLGLSLLRANAIPYTAVSNVTYSRDLPRSCGDY